MSDSPKIPPFPVVTIPTEVADSQQAVDFLLGQLVLLGIVEAQTPAALVQHIQRREQLGSTAIGKGVAIPHCTTDTVSAVVGIIGKSVAGISWPGSADGQPVHLVCLLVTPRESPDARLRTLEQLVRQLRSDTP